VQQYYNALANKDYKTAYDLQPASNKTDDLKTFQANIESYQQTNIKVGTPQISGTTGTVTVGMTVMGQSGWSKVWTFAQKDGKWYLISAKAGM
jgi:hypothetical protein